MAMLSDASNIPQDGIGKCVDIGKQVGLCITQTTARKVVGTTEPDAGVWGVSAARQPQELEFTAAQVPQTFP